MVLPDTPGRDTVQTGRQRLLQAYPDESLRAFSYETGGWLEPVELLGRARPEVFETTDGMNQLRRWVHDGVQSAAGDVQIRNVLFRKINFM